MACQLRSLSYADIASLANAMCGLLAIMFAMYSPSIAARLILLAAIADGIDGILARKYGSSPVGIYLDSLSDAVSFGIAPVVLLASIVNAPETVVQQQPIGVVTMTVTIVFVAMALIRLAFYTAESTHQEYTIGVPTTLAASILAALYLAGVNSPIALLGVAGILSIMMVSSITYPDLRVRDALIMGVLQALAVLVPTVFENVFPLALLLCAMSYLLLSPLLYRTDEDFTPSRS